MAFAGKKLHYCRTHTVLDNECDLQRVDSSGSLQPQQLLYCLVVLFLLRIDAQRNRRSNSGSFLRLRSMEEIHLAMDISLWKGIQLNIVHKCLSRLESLQLFVKLRLDLLDFPFKGEVFQ
jgi:hypothetical protein